MSQEVKETFEAKDVGVGETVTVVFHDGFYLLGKILLLVIDIATGGLTYVIRNYSTGGIEKIDPNDVDHVEIHEYE